MSEDKFKIVRSPVIEDAELPETHKHNDIDQPAIDVEDVPAGTDHALLSNVTIDQHHARDHATRHLSGGGDELSLTVLEGGTGIETYTQGDIIYSSAANTLAKLVKNTTATRYLSNTGTDNNPAWALVNLANGVTGTLPVANGGTGATTLTGILLGNGTSAVTALASTGTGDVVRATSPTLVTPTLGAATVTTISVSAIQVLGAQGAAVADASGGATIDAEARTAINTLLARLRTHGMIAT